MAEVDFRVQFPYFAERPPTGFLFLCPGEDFEISPSSFRWPECPVYWSRHPSGADTLTGEEAGFPPIELTSSIHGHYWDTSVYARLRQFYPAKGFDPDGLDVARYLGHPVFRLSCGMNAAFDHDKFPMARRPPLLTNHDKYSRRLKIMRRRI